MNVKSNILRAVNHERPERIPVAILSGGVWSYNNKGYSLQEVLGNAGLMAEIIIDTNKDVRSDIVWVGSGFNNLPVRALGGKIKFRAKGAPDVQEPLLKTPGDVDHINIDKLSQDEGIKSIWDSAAIVSNALGNETLVGVSGWGPFSLAAQLYGVEKMMHQIYKDKSAVHAILEFATELSFRYYQPSFQAGAQILSIAEPTSSGDMISRNHFIEFALPYQKKIMNRVKSEGAFSLFHICGNITDRLDLIPESGADVISVDYKVDLARAKEIIGTKLVIAGNVNPVDVLEVGTPELVNEKASECIKKAGADGNFILMPGCDIPHGVPLENLKSFIDTGLNWPLN